jgi:hypothetical protein
MDRRRENIPVSDDIPGTYGDPCANGTGDRQKLPARHSHMCILPEYCIEKFAVSNTKLSRWKVSR